MIRLTCSPRGKYCKDRQRAVLRQREKFLIDVTTATATAGGTYRARTGPHCCNGGCGKR